MINNLDTLKTKPDFSDYPLILLGFGGSIAYGTVTKESDVDIRGITENTVSELIGLDEDRESIVFKDSDVTLYTLKKVLCLFAACNPNVIEMLGLNPEHYLYISDIGQEILNNKSIFLSKRAALSFGGYAISQLHKLNQMRDMLKSGWKKRICGKMAKHQMHLLRLYIMGIDILQGEIITYREKEHGLLMQIRNGEFLKDDEPTKEFDALLKDYERRFNEVANKSKLPEKVDMNKINELAIKLNRQIINKHIPKN